MITPKDLQEAIAYYSGKVDPQPNDAVMLAACYTLQDHLFLEAKPETTYSIPPEPPETNYSYSGADAEAVGEYGDSDFLLAVSGKDPAAVWAIMDDLMDTLRTVEKRAYNRVMREIREIQ